MQEIPQIGEHSRKINSIILGNMENEDIKVESNMKSKFKCKNALYPNIVNAHDYKEE
jgi:hypothetical protein